MNEQTLTIESTATGLKKELRGSLEVLKRDFESLKRFVEELANNGASASISLTKEDLDDLLFVALEIRDAASDIEFEADKIKEKLNRCVTH